MTNTSKQNKLTVSSKEHQAEVFIYLNTSAFCMRNTDTRIRGYIRSKVSKIAFYMSYVMIYGASSICTEI